MPLSIAILGTGDMASQHAEAFAALDDVRLVAACDLKQQRVEAFADDFDIPATYTDPAEMLANPSVEAVSIVTPDSTHHTLALQALKHKVHVLCEKPLATTYEEADEMATVAEDAGVMHMVNFSYRRSAALYEAHRLVEEGALGDLRHIEASYLQSWLVSNAWGAWNEEEKWLWRLSTDHGSAGVLGDVGVHLLDFATFPAGPVRGLHCALHTFPKVPDDPIEGYTLDANDSALITVQFENGALGTLHSSRWATGRDNTIRLAIHGTHGAVRLNLEEDPSLLQCCLGDDVHTFTWRDRTCPDVPTIYERFVRSIRTGTQEQPDFRRGAAIQRLLDQCFASDEAEAWVTMEG